MGVSLKSSSTYLTLTAVGVLAFSLWLGCESRPQKDPVVTIFGEANLASMRNSHDVAASLIDATTSEEDNSAMRETSDQYPVTTELGTVGQQRVDEFLDILTDPDTYEWNSAKACIFTPGVKISFKTANDTVEVMFCFECDILAVFVDKKPVSGGNFDYGRPKIVNWLKKSFPGDAVIQTLRSSY